MDNRLDNMSVTEMRAFMADNPELQREQVLLDMILDAITKRMGTQKCSPRKTHYRLAELINSHRKNTVRRT